MQAVLAGWVDLTKFIFSFPHFFFFYSALDGCGLDEDDPEYSFPPDEEDIRLKDPEELRDDRATKESLVVDIMYDKKDGWPII